MKYAFEVVEVDNRDSQTTEITLPNGDVLEVTRQDLEDLIQNMIDNEPPEEVPWEFVLGERPT